MSTLSNLIFKNASHKMTSPFGPRKVINTSAGKTSSFHNGTDYGTSGKKLPQYAIADGEVLSCGKDAAYGNAIYVWVNYPTYGVKMLHYHLDSYKVKKGQKLKKGDLIGYTGMTGKSTAIHLHLGVKPTKGADSGKYIDPEKWSKDVLDAKPETEAKDTPKSIKKSYKVVADLLNVRTDPIVDSKNVLPFEKLTKSAQSKILKLKGSKANGYVKGLTFDADKTQVTGIYTFVHTPSGWVCIKKGNDVYCKEI